MYVLAVDVGKTKTIAALLDDSLSIIGYAIAGPADITLDKDVVLRNISKAIEDCLSSQQLSVKDTDLIVISWAGLDTSTDRRLAEAYTRELGLPLEKTRIIHDAESALYTVTWGKPGIAVIAGTGAIAYGMNKKGETARSSGWGWFIGDEGSASWIAIRALNAASRAYDGRGEKTTLVDRIKDFFGVSDFLDIIPVVHRKRLFNNISLIARIAIIVDEEAEKGDAVSQKILEEAGRELALAAYSVAKKLDMGHEEDIIVGGVGSVYRSRIVRMNFEKYLKQYLPKALIREPIIGYQAVLGPIIYALHVLGYKIDEEIVGKLARSVRDISNETSRKKVDRR